MLNKLTLRPLLWAILSLILVSGRQIFIFFGETESNERYFVVVDRMAKLSAMVLGMSLNFEKEILNMFMIFQLSYKLDEFAVAKEDYRRLEHLSTRINKIELISVAVFAAVISIVTLVPFTDFYTNWINGIIDLCMLCLNATVVRSAISHNLTFFHKLYRSHRYEFHRHVRRELPK